MADKPLLATWRGAILSMADRQDLLLAQKVEDLRRKVFELAALIGDLVARRKLRDWHLAI